MSEFPRAVLGDLVKHQKGFAFKSKDYQEAGIPVVRVSNFTDDSIDTSDLKYVTAEMAKENKKVALKTYDVVIATVGSWPKNPASIVGKTICVPSEINGGLMNQNSVILRVKNECEIDQKFLYITLKTKLFSEYLISTAQGSANQASVTLRDIFSYEIEWPEPDVRKSIVSIIDSLNMKIVLNRQTNQTLEHIAQAIYKSWFVDFEPTRAKIAAREQFIKDNPDVTEKDIRSATDKDSGSAGYAGAIACERAAMAAISGKSLDQLDQLSPEQQAELKQTAALFPDVLVESELGQIPEEWEIGSVGDVAIAKGGYAFKGKSFVEKGHPVVKIKNITADGRVDINGAVCIDDEQAKSSMRFKLDDGNLLMAMTGATVGKIGLVVTEGTSVYLNQRVAKFESEKFGNKIAWFLFCCFQRDSVFESVVGSAQGSAQPNISSAGIESTRLIMPSDELIHIFCNSVNALFKKWLSTINENSILEANRDSLLPKLLSGELEIGAAS